MDIDQITENGELFNRLGKLISENVQLRHDIVILRSELNRLRETEVIQPTPNVNNLKKLKNQDE